MRHGTHMNASWHTHECAIHTPAPGSNRHERIVSHTNETCHTYQWVINTQPPPTPTNGSLTLPPPPTTYEWVINTRTPSHTNPQKISHSNPIHLNLQPKIAGTKKEEKGRVVGNTSQPSTKNRRDKKGREHYYTPARIEHYYTPARIQRRAIYKKRSFT